GASDELRYAGERWFCTPLSLRLRSNRQRLGNSAIVPCRRRAHPGKRRNRLMRRVAAQSGLIKGYAFFTYPLCLWLRRWKDDIRVGAREAGGVVVGIWVGVGGWCRADSERQAERA